MVFEVISLLSMKRNNFDNLVVIFRGTSINIAIKVISIDSKYF